MLPTHHDFQGLNSSDRVSIPVESDQISLTVEVISLDIPNADVLAQAFEKVRTLPVHLKPIVMEGIAKKLKVSKKTLDKSFEFWMMERISQHTAAADVQATQNGEER